MNLINENYPWLSLQPNSEIERVAFQERQERFKSLYEEVFSNPQESRTILVNPSLSFDSAELDKIDGIYFYEERLLCLLLLLQFPRTQIIYLSSHPMQQDIIDYYLHLLPGVPSNHAKKRLVLFSCHDSSSTPLSQKVLERPRLLEKIRQAIRNPEESHMICFNVTNMERTLATELQLPIYGCDPDLGYLGSKSWSRILFKQAKLDVAEGYENIHSASEIALRLFELKTNNPSLRKAVVKLNEGFSGEGNALFSFDNAPTTPQPLKQWIESNLPLRLQYEASSENWGSFSRKMKNLGGIVEAWIEGSPKESPSVQLRIDPKGNCFLVSTHDQILGGINQQVFLGCTFPAHQNYRKQIQEDGMKIAQLLQEKGVIGRFSIDFISVQDKQGKWKNYAIEINLRKGGTTLPYLMLEFLTNGNLDRNTGIFQTPSGQIRTYFASDNLQSPKYKGLTPSDLMDILVENQLYFHNSRQEGVVFHIMGALSEFGKLGIVCIAPTIELAQKYYQETVAALDKETDFQFSRKLSGEFQREC